MLTPVDAKKVNISNTTNADTIVASLSTIQTVNSPIQNMSASGNAAELGTVHSNIQTTESCLSLVGIESTMH